MEDETTVKGRTNLLRKACMNGDFELANYCVFLGADLSDNWFIENSSYYGYYDIVELLLKNGANPYGHGSTIACSAARGHYRVVRLLKVYIRNHKINKILNLIIIFKYLLDLEPVCISDIKIKNKLKIN